MFLLKFIKLIYLLSFLQINYYVFFPFFLIFLVCVFFFIITYFIVFYKKKRVHFIVYSFRKRERWKKISKEIIVCFIYCEICFISHLICYHIFLKMSSTFFKKIKKSTLVVYFLSIFIFKALIWVSVRDEITIFIFNIFWNRNYLKWIF